MLYANIVDYLMGDISEAALTEAEKTVAKKIQDAPKFKSPCCSWFGPVAAGGGPRQDAGGGGGARAATVGRGPCGGPAPVTGVAVI